MHDKFYNLKGMHSQTLVIVGTGGFQWVEQQLILSLERPIQDGWIILA
jgi:hypothetical protein